MDIDFDLDELNKRLIDCKEEINNINKILDYCCNWTDRLELEMEAHDTSKLKNVICAPGSFRGFDIIGEEYAIIDEMVNYCHKRIDELKHELTDIRGWLSRYNHGDYDVTSEHYKWFNDRFNKRR